MRCHGGFPNAPPAAVEAWAGRSKPTALAHVLAPVQLLRFPIPQPSHACSSRLPDTMERRCAAAAKRAVLWQGMAMKNEVGMPTPSNLGFVESLYTECSRGRTAVFAEWQDYFERLEPCPARAG